MPISVSPKQPERADVDDRSTTSSQAKPAAKPTGESRQFASLLAGTAFHANPAHARCELEQRRNRGGE